MREAGSRCLIARDRKMCNYSIVSQSTLQTSLLGQYKGERVWFRLLKTKIVKQNQMHYRSNLPPHPAVCEERRRWSTMVPYQHLRGNILLVCDKVFDNQSSAPDFSLVCRNQLQIYPARTFDLRSQSIRQVLWNLIRRFLFRWPRKAYIIVTEAVQ